MKTPQVERVRLGGLVGTVCLQRRSLVFKVLARIWRAHALGVLEGALPAALLLASSLLNTACGPVAVNPPISQEVLVVDERLLGWWRFTSEEPEPGLMQNALVVGRGEREANSLVLYSIEIDDAGRVHLEQGHVRSSEANPVRYLCISLHEEPSWMIFCYEISADGALVLFPLKTDMAVSAIRQGLLTGREVPQFRVGKHLAIGRSAIIETAGTLLRDWIHDNHAACFDFDRPFELNRIT